MTDYAAVELLLNYSENGKDVHMCVSCVKIFTKEKAAVLQEGTKSYFNEIKTLVAERKDNTDPDYCDYILLVGKMITDIAYYNKKVEDFVNTEWIVKDAIELYEEVE